MNLITWILLGVSVIDYRAVRKSQNLVELQKMWDDESPDQNLRCLLIEERTYRSDVEHSSAVAGHRTDGHLGNKGSLPQTQQSFHIDEIVNGDAFPG